MSLLLTVSLGSAIGTVVGNGALLWFIGHMAQKTQRKQAEAIAEMQSMLLAEQERMREYARMES